MPTELDGLRAEIARLQRRVAELETARDTAVATRRQLFRLGAGAAAGAVLAAGPARAASAGAGDPMFVGWTHQSMVGTTILSGDETLEEGTPLVDGAPVLQVSVVGVPPEAAPRAVVATADAGTALEAASSGGVGVVAQGTVGSLRIGGAPTGPLPPPQQRGGAAVTGLIDLDANGDVWLCVGSGTPGTWRELGGANSAGAFHAISPHRVYDSRVAADGAFTPNSSRLLSVATGRTASGGLAHDVVPPGATAITFTLTAAGATGPNFLSVMPGDDATFATSTLNFPGGFDCASGGVVRLDGDRHVRVFCGDQAGSTHVILDVTGYYR